MSKTPFLAEGGKKEGERVKRPRKLTREEKICLSTLGYDPDNYRVIEVKDNILHLIHKRTGHRLCVSK